MQRRAGCGWAVCRWTRRPWRTRRCGRPCQATSRSGRVCGRERLDRGADAHAHLMLSLDSAPRGSPDASTPTGRSRLRHRRGSGRGDLDGPGSPSTWKGRARSGACLASITRTVVILVGPPFGSHGRSGCVVVTGDRGGRHGTVTPGRPAHWWRRAVSAGPVIRVGPGPSPRLADDDPAAHSIAGLRGQHHDLVIDPTRTPAATAIQPCRSQPSRIDEALCVIHPVGEGQGGE